MSNVLSNFPGCMMPDGGEACPEYAAAIDEVARLRSRTAAMEAALKHVLHTLHSRSDGRLEPANARIRTTTMVVNKALAGGTMSLDAYIEDEVRTRCAKLSGGK